MMELLKRAASHLERLVGSTEVDMGEATILLANLEEEDLQKASTIELAGQETPLGWDWSSKVFDVFLSHKITDAKDVVLSWYNALSALGYHPFLDRLSLDAVENIPMYVEQTVTFAIAVSSNLWQSYWCAIELCTAVVLHANGQLNILLIPIQGDKFTDAEGAKLDFPTPEIMMQNWAKWMPDLEEATVANVRALYGGLHTDYTYSRYIKHTLMHYKSFERLFIARCGASISAQLEIKKLIASGGALVEDQARTLAPLIAEINAIEARLYGEEANTYHTAVKKGQDHSHARLVVKKKERRRDGKDVGSQRF